MKRTPTSVTIHRNQRISVGSYESIEVHVEATYPLLEGESPVDVANDEDVKLEMRAAFLQGVLDEVECVRQRREGWTGSQGTLQDLMTWVVKEAEELNSKQ